MKITCRIISRILVIFEMISNCKCYKMIRKYQLTIILGYQEIVCYEFSGRDCQRRILFIRFEAFGRD